MHRWEELAVREIALAGQQEMLAFRNSLPEYLDQLVDALKTTTNRTEAKIKVSRGSVILLH